MSSWVAAPLAVVLVLATAVAAMVVIYIIGWIVEHVEWWIRGSHVEVVVQAIGMILSLTLVVVVIGVAWFSIFSWLKGWV